MSYTYNNGSTIIDYEDNVWTHPQNFDPEPEEEEESAVTEEESIDYPPLKMEFSGISRKGVIKLYFSEDILSLEEVLGRNLAEINYDRVLDVSLDVNSDVGVLDYDIELVSWEP